MKSLDRAERLHLMRFVCSFVWADLEVRGEERAFVRKMVKRLDLDEEEVAKVEEWLKVPPRPEDVDPTTVPRAHRALFLQAAREAIEADGKITAEEHENYKLFAALLS